MRPSASSTWASMPIRPAGSPSVCSRLPNARSTNAMSPAFCTLGTMMQSRASPAPVTISCRSSNANALDTWLMRTPRTLPRQSWVRRASTILPRAAGFSSGAQASSRSRNTSSAADAAAFSIIRGLLPGQARTDRRRREGIEAPSSGACGRRRLIIGAAGRGRPGAVVVGIAGRVRRRGGARAGGLAGAAGHREAEAADQLGQLLRSAQVLLDAVHHPHHQLLQVGILGQLLLDAAELPDQVLDRRLLGHLHEHRLAGRCDHHLGLLAEDLETLARQARALVLAAAELRLEAVELAVQTTEIYTLAFIGHEVILAMRTRGAARPHQRAPAPSATAGSTAGAGDPVSRLTGAGQAGRLSSRNPGLASTIWTSVMRRSVKPASQSERYTVQVRRKRSSKRSGSPGALRSRFSRHDARVGG